MNGAEALIESLWDAGVEVCFANPGTSEMQLVAAIDKHPHMRSVLGLFEGVVTGAADGYGRMTGKPAATLLHLGPGLANGLSNLHNAKRARSPIVNIVGDHATHHQRFDAPLASDVVGVASPMSDWVATSTSAQDLAVKGVEAVAAAQAYPGQIATVIAPADHAWSEAEGPAAPREWPAPQRPAQDKIAQAMAALRSGETAALFLGGAALSEAALEQAGRIAAATGARLICETFPARLQRGQGRVPVERLPYFGEMASDHLKDIKHLIFIGAKPPVSFFAYPGKPSWLSPEDGDLIAMADPREDALAGLTALADELGAPKAHGLHQAAQDHPMPSGPLDAGGLGAVINALMPEDAIVSDEGATNGLFAYLMTQGARKHDWITLTGGSIGQGLPVGIGAALACPDRKTICLQADGSGMYTVQSLWTMARENLNIATVIINNSSYAILNIELDRVGVKDPGPKAKAMLSLDHPRLDWVKISEGMGVPARRAATVEEFHDAWAWALNHDGPRLVEAIVP